MMSRPEKNFVFFPCCRDYRTKDKGLKQTDYGLTNGKGKFRFVFMEKKC